jgi:hypothetical protein
MFPIWSTPVKVVTGHLDTWLREEARLVEMIRFRAHTLRASYAVRHSSCEMSKVSAKNLEHLDFSTIQPLTKLDLAAWGSYVGGARTPQLVRRCPGLH